MLKGNNLILSINGTPLGAARTCGIDRNTDTIEVCSPVDGPARSFITGATSWSISAGGLYANKEAAERLRSIWRKHQKGGVVTPLTIQVATDARAVEQGEAILASLKEQGDHGSLVKFTIQLQGTGSLELLPYISGWSMWLNDYNMELSDSGSVSLVYKDPLPRLNFYIHAIDIELSEPRTMTVSGHDGRPLVLCRNQLSLYDSVKETKNPLPINFNREKVFTEETTSIQLQPGKYCMFINMDNVLKTHPTITVE